MKPTQNVAFRRSQRAIGADLVRNRSADEPPATQRQREKQLAVQLDRRPATATNVRLLGKLRINSTSRRAAGELRTPFHGDAFRSHRCARRAAPRRIRLRPAA
jgi:hypothetical protein